MIPVFQEQAQISALGMEAFRDKDMIIKTSQIAQRHLEINAKLVTHLAAQTAELLMTPLYDVEQARKLEYQIRDNMHQLNQIKMDWAAQISSLTSPTEDAHYAKPE
jgi:hypothetical protein